MNLEKTKSIRMIAKTPRIKKVAKLLILFLLLFTIFISFTPWQQTAKGSGRVIAFSPTEREQRISAPIEGRIESWFVHEGTYVQKGDKIAQLYDNDPLILENLKAEKKATELKVKAARQARVVAKINVDRQALLFKKGVSSQRQYEVSKLEYNKLQSEEASAKAELSRINIRLSRQQTLLIKAPIKGYILRRMAGQEGVMVKSGEVLAILVPDTRSRAVELYVDGNDAPLIHKGQRARLQFEGWPAIQFAGWPSVAVGTFGGVVSVIDAADDGHGRFRVLIEQDPDEKWPDNRYLRQGVRATGWILLNTVTLAFELWRQFNGFPPAQSAPPRTYGIGQADPHKKHKAAE